MMRRPIAVFALLTGLAAATGAWRGSVVPPHDAALAARVDAVFARWNTADSPGCTVAASRDATTLVSRAYGLADLEQGTRNTPDTIVEAGSISKQFTAAAMILLARDGKLSLEDQARRYLPELPDYGRPLTIRQMLAHTSGLRDWGDLAAVSGWPRGTRAHRHAHVLDIASRQRALNFLPGEEWSYSNTGYNLAAVIVARASGQSFAAFSRDRLFAPLGLTRTSWRDDYRRVVRGRATAYTIDTGGTIRTMMPFEDVHGNGGLLTTVGDLIAWNEHLASDTQGGAALAVELERPSRLADGRETGYGLGLFLGTYKGLREISHGGATAGYRAFLARYPEARASVAVLCNADNAGTAQLAHQVADLVLADRLTTAAPPRDGVALPEPLLRSKAGLYRSLRTGQAATLVFDHDALRFERGPVLTPLAPTTFRIGAGPATAEFEAGANDRAARLRVTWSPSDVDTYEAVARATPAPADLLALAGRYRSDEADAEVALAVDDGVLTARRRPDDVWTLRPLYADAYEAPFGLVRIVRAANGRVSEMSVGTSRMRDLRFRRVSP
jgi:CubicO group peptidase (beta-lactamase class C family)